MQNSGREVPPHPFAGHGEYTGWVYIIPSARCDPGLHAGSSCPELRCGSEKPLQKKQEQGSSAPVCGNDRA